MYVRHTGSHFQRSSRTYTVDHPRSPGFHRPESEEDEHTGLWSASRRIYPPTETPQIYTGELCCPIGTYIHIDNIIYLHQLYVWLSSHLFCTRVSCSQSTTSHVDVDITIYISIYLTQSYISWTISTYIHRYIDIHTSLVYHLHNNITVDRLGFETIAKPPSRSIETIRSHREVHLHTYIYTYIYGTKIKQAPLLFSY